MKRRKKISKSKSPEETPKTISLDNVVQTLNTIQTLIVTVAAHGADTHNRLEGLISNKIHVNGCIEDLDQRVRDIEEQVKILKSQDDFQKVPDLLDKLTQNSKGIKDEIASIQRRAHTRNDSKK